MNGKDFIKAVDNIVKEMGIEADVVFEAMELALIAAYKKNFDGDQNVKVEINGIIKVFSYKMIVEEVEDDIFEISLEDAKKIDPSKEIGDTIDEEVTPKDFGRVAASTAKQVIVQKLREAERNSIMGEFGDKEGELLAGTVALEDTDNYYIDLGRMNGILPKKDLIPGETIEMGSSIKVYVTKVDNNGKGLLILLSRRHFGFLKRLFELEIPELADGSVMIYSVAREAGVRSKVAVYSENDRIDPIGACIGERGTRIANILKEVGTEKIDVIRYDKDPAIFIANALSPAKEVNVMVTDPKKQEAIVVADGDNFSLAIGRKGQNAKLASKLTRYRIDIKTREQASDLGIVIRSE